MMNYRRQNNIDPTRPAVIVAFAVLALIVIDFFSGGFLRNSVRGILVPIWAAPQTIEESGVLPHFDSEEQVRAENETLKARIRELASVGLTNQVLEAEVRALRELLDDSADTPRVLARILGAGQPSGYDTLVLNRGRLHGVALGDVAKAEGGVALGIVEELHDTIAVVRLFSAPSTNLSVRIGPEGDLIEAEGIGNANILVRAPHGMAVEQGMVVTSPEAGGAAIVLVGEILSEATAPFSEVLISLSFNIRSVRLVTIEHAQ